ncbi:alpha-2-HS-glycoprotein-like isoform X2 [Gymnodraco acuticeps]|uniref:Alpha-2-HS-glycoprotein-like isoform X2 n=1 Tax=Gymnodraco acuticeps TaxID=8218 RepID=A0A6P8WTZ1_GYMAC|nr:alpha-2-HS-glycoprotein-like isoform X2 [Gymnodraco acuticeps]
MYLSIMKGLPTLLLLCSTALLCSAAPAVEPVTCSEDGGAAAARMAAHHIDEKHDHGYKFKLSEIKGNKVEKVDDGCEIELQLDLMETTCHNINPKHFEDCMIRGETQRAVMANCSVRINVINGDAKVRNYHCDTRQVKTDSEMVSICTDCPNLISLHDPEGMKSVKEAVQRVNENTTNQNYFILKDVGRIKIGWTMTGMNYWAEIALVESHCRMGSRILPEACKPLCPDRARHALCHSSYSKSKGLMSVECDYYPPMNSTALGDGEREPICRHHGGRGPPDHDGPGGRGPPDRDGPRGRGPPDSDGPRGRGPPDHDGPGGRGPPDHDGPGGRGPPDHDGPGGRGPPPPTGGDDGGPPPPADGGPPDQERQRHRAQFHRLHCHGSDAAIHPICPWPRPEPRPEPRGPRLNPREEA